MAYYFAFIFSDYWYIVYSLSLGANNCMRCVKKESSICNSPHSVTLRGLELLELTFQPCNPIERFRSLNQGGYFGFSEKNEEGEHRGCTPLRTGRAKIRPRPHRHRSASRYSFAIFELGSWLMSREAHNTQYRYVIIFACPIRSVFLRSSSPIVDRLLSFFITIKKEFYKTRISLSLT